MKKLSWNVLDAIEATCMIVFAVITVMFVAWSLFL